MHGAALLLLVALTGPAIVNLACGLSCGQHEHHGATAVPAEDCHAHEPGGDGPALTTVARAFCHAAADPAAATIRAAVRLRVGAGVLLDAAPARAVEASWPSLIDRAFRARPPGILLITTPLRI